MNKVDICSLNNSLAILILLVIARFSKIIARVKYGGVRRSYSPVPYQAAGINPVARWPGFPAPYQARFV